MSSLRSKSLSAGEFYGQVPRKRLAASAILSEIVHQNEVDVPEHSHQLAYFTLLLEGGYVERFAGKTNFHQSMSILWHQAGISHQDHICRGGGRFFTIELQPAGLDTLIQFARVPDDFSERNSSLVWLACRLYHEFKNWQECSNLVTEGLTLELLGHSARRQIPAERRPPGWLGRVVERLNEEFTENLSTEELAREAGVHPVHLATVFRRAHHQTIGEYVQKCRVAEASRLLFKKEISLAEVAYAAGFSDQSHFTRIFKRHLGITPGQFRNSL